MKKKLVALLTMMTVLACLMLTACSLGTAGTYKFKSASATVAGKTVELTGDEAKYFAEISLVLNKDKTYSVKMGDTEVSTGTWEKKKKTITFTENGKTVSEYTVDGKTISTTSEIAGVSATVVYEKQ